MEPVGRPRACSLTFCRGKGAGESGECERRVENILSAPLRLRAFLSAILSAVALAKAEVLTTADALKSAGGAVPLGLPRRQVTVNYANLRQLTVGDTPQPASFAPPNPA
jgi:hypothetical protein